MAVFTATLGFLYFMDEFKPKLQILVPQYKEDESIIKHLLDSIEIQQRIDLQHDISVIIVNDGSDVLLSEEFLSRYTYPIFYIRAEHRGVSATRNTALDLATADYVMFCDADDAFYITHALWMIFEDLKENGDVDVINSAFLEEVFYVDKSFAKLMKHEQDRTFVHGKIYRRGYLVDNNIRWNDELQIHEDVYFNTLALVCTKNVRHQDTPFYLWRFRPDSICRDDPLWNLKTYPALVKTNTELVKQFIAREMIEAAWQIVVFVLMDAYYTFQLPLWHDEENIGYRDAAERAVGLFVHEYGGLFYQSSVDFRRTTSAGIRDRIVKCGMVMELVSFPDWMGHVAGLGDEEAEKLESKE